MQDIFAIIPARSGSKGVQNKNIKILAGKPLIAYSIAVARMAKNINRVIVSTDSEQYASIAREYGAEVPFLRPKEISGDNSTDYEVIKHTLDWFLCTEKMLPKYLVHLRPTTPLRDLNYINNAIDIIRQNNEATSLRSVHEMSESAYKTFEVENGYLKSVGSGSFELDSSNEPRQKFIKTYHGNGYVDVILSSFVMESKKIHGNRVLAYITPFINEVDVENDFKYLEYEISSNPTLFSRIFI